MRVHLLNHTPQPIRVIYVAARTCSSQYLPQKIWEEYPSKEKMYALIDKIVNAGHYSILEHVSFTFAIEGISRACSHQLVRHRIASFSQQSQRYVNTDHSRFVEPRSIEADKRAQKIFKSVMNRTHNAYMLLRNLGIPAEDARYLLTNATRTNILMTMNLRELATASAIRLCTRAQWEIREVFLAIRAEIRNTKQVQGFATYLQPKCFMLGHCPEIRSCGQRPPKEEHVNTLKKNDKLVEVTLPRQLPPPKGGGVRRIPTIEEVLRP